MLVPKRRSWKPKKQVIFLIKKLLEDVVKIEIKRVMKSTLLVVVISMAVAVESVVVKI